MQIVNRAAAILGSVPAVAGKFRHAIQPEEITPKMSERNKRRQPEIMHLAQFLVHGPTYHSVAMWRHPRSTVDGLDWARPEIYQRIARICERGLLDMVFFADLNFISDLYTGSIDPAVRYAAQAPCHDPTPLLSWMGAVTEKIGLSATFSVNHHSPFYAARLWATIDHLTSGRAGWNVVTSFNPNEFANHGDDPPPPELRYDRAWEFIEVCQKLWESWEPDALVLDRKTPRFADPEKVHRIEHRGRYFASRGPLNVIRSPQVGPAILQAGTSPKGIAFAAAFADGVFAIQPSLKGAKTYFDAVKSAAQRAGRPPEHCRMLFGVQPILGRSREEALERQCQHNELVPLEAGLAVLSGHANLDLSRFDLDDTVETSAELAASRSARVFRDLDGRPLSVREAGQRHGQSVGLPQITGTATDIADQLETLYDHIGGDGFMLSPVYLPGAIEEFVDHVVPELQRRGRFRTAYHGRTQRDHLRQAR